MADYSGETMNEVHSQKLVACCQAIIRRPDLPESVWTGRSAADWLGSVTRGQDQEKFDFSIQTFDTLTRNRPELLQKISDARADYAVEPSDKLVRELVVDVLAWGGMGTKYGRTALPAWESWKHACVGLFNGSLNASEAYECFYELQRDRRMPGIGPAYYTKLIFFLGKGDGLIMDQWTGRSVNLLFGNFIRIDREHAAPDRATVNSQNKAAVYLKYIDHVQKVASHLSASLNKDISTDKAEEFLFSISPKKKPRTLNRDQHAVVSAWRKHVIESDRTQRLQS